MNRHLIAACAILAVSACGNPSSRSDDPLNESETSETAPPAQQDAQDAAERDFAQTMPEALRGDWHKADLGRAPTAEDCDPRLRGTIDWDRLITVRDGGYSYFETGGRIMEVHNRTDTMIDATFDTTYADTPTSERRDFALQDDGSMAINLDDGDGTMNVVEYLPCPER